ncbi:MAG: glutaredoxin 3, partial [Proteobacteria bacterium]|nr:glutaredoxin 3 [Pseudomonadota bacterium]
MSKVEIYTTMLCGYCGAAKRLLNKKGVEFVEYNVMFKPGLRSEMMERAGGATSVPQIFIGDVAIGGFDELMELEQDDEL